MINVGEFFDTLNDLYNESVNGYISDDQFNRLSSIGEDLVYKYWLMQDDGKAKSAALGVFTKNEEVVFTDGIAIIPDDFKRNRFLFIWEKIDGKVVKTPTMEYMGDEVAFTEQNSIRKGKEHHYRVEINEDIKIYPRNSGIGTLRYYRKPTYAKRVTDFDAVNKVDNYNDNTSTHYEWREAQRQDLLDVMLYLFGIEGRDSVIVQFLGQKGLLPQNVYDND